jgi:crotonobetaine/carnitine-CoA ligase
MAIVREYLAHWEQRCREVESAELPRNFRAVIDTAAEKYGDHLAIRFIDTDDPGLTYEELRETVMRVASAFSQIGIREGAHVAVMLPNRVEFPLTWLALACLGAVIVPTNVSYTSGELDYVYNDADVSWLVIDASLLAVFEAMQERPAALEDSSVVVVGDGGENGYRHFAKIVAAADPAFDPPVEPAPDALLNIQYTSGTTGFPKGCMQTQRYWIVLGRTAGSMSPPVRSLLTDHPYFYMDPQWELMWGLLDGVTVYAVGRMSTTKFWDRVRKHNIEWAWFPNPILKLPVEEHEADNPIRMFAAGWISVAAIKEAEERYGAPVRPAYGMTEIGGGTFVPEEIPDDEILDTVGLRAPFRDLRIVDDSGNDVAEGTPGELIVRGDGIFLGYYKKPEANAESFYGDWFRTGDMFVRTASGYYRIIGRYKDMIRRSDENISAMEVEHVVRMIDAVKDAAAVPVPDDHRGEEVKMYVQLKDGLTKSDCEPETIIEHCRAHLAPFKVPRYVAFVEEMPYTPSNKVAKHEMIAGVGDLRKDAWDAQDGLWR